MVLDHLYDKTGFRTDLIATVDGTADFKNTYTPDALGRLVRVEQSSQEGVSPHNEVAEKRVDFTYNVAGEYTTVTRYKDLDGGVSNEVMTATYTHDKLSRLTDLTYTHHANPTPTVLRDFGWTYDAAGRVTSHDSDIAAEDITRYDAFNRRVASLYDDNGNGSPDRIERYVRDGSNVVLDLVDADGAGTQRVLEVARRYLWGSTVDELLAQEGVASGQAGPVDWVVRDNLGTTRSLVDSAGQITGTFTYDTFGDPTATPETQSLTRYLFTCQEYDLTTAFYYYDARWYDARTGRFMNEDPIGSTSNLYAYCGDDPAGASDPSGEVIEYVSNGKAAWYHVYATGFWGDRTFLGSVEFDPRGSTASQRAAETIAKDMEAKSRPFQKIQVPFEPYDPGGISATHENPADWNRRARFVTLNEKRTKGLVMSGEEIGDLKSYYTEMEIERKRQYHQGMGVAASACDSFWNPAFFGNINDIVLPIGGLAGSRVICSPDPCPQLSASPTVATQPFLRGIPGSDYVNLNPKHDEAEVAGGKLMHELASKGDIPGVVRVEGRPEQSKKREARRLCVHMREWGGGAG